MNPNQHNSSANPCQLRHNLCAGRTATDFKHEICARAPGPFFCICEKICFQGIHNLKAQCPRLCQTKGIHFGNHHLGPIQSRRHSNQHPNRAAANHNRAIAQFHFCTPNIVNSDRKRFNKRASIVVQCIGYAVQTIEWCIPKSLKCTRRVNTQKIQILTNMSMSPTASCTRTTCHRGFNHHAIAHFEFGIFWNLYNLTAHLVSHHQRNLHPLIHVPLINVQIRTAQTRPRHLDEHLIITQFGFRNIAQFNPLGTQINRRFHITSTITLEIQGFVVYVTPSQNAIESRSENQNRSAFMIPHRTQRVNT